MRTTIRTGTLLAVALLIAACATDGTDGAADVSGQADDQDADVSGQADDQDADVTAREDAEPAAEAHVSVANSELGDILVDGDGMTLYLFTNDSDGRSTCEDDCATAWPPLVVEGEPIGGEGIDASLLGTTERGDDRLQVTFAGWPLYTWAQDEQPGDVTGQGVQEVWFVVSPEGEPVAGDAGEAPEREDGY